jgi:hypothetical protein
MDLDGEAVHLNMDQNLDQDTHIPVYILQSDDSSNTQMKRAFLDEQVSFTIEMKNEMKTFL